MFKFYTSLMILGVLHLRLCSSTVQHGDKNTSTVPISYLTMKIHTLLVKDPRKLMTLAKVLFNQKEYNRAKQLCTKAIDYDSADNNKASYYALRGKCHMELRHPLGALDDFKEAVSLASSSGVEIDLNEHNFAKLADELLPWKNYEGAIWCYDKAIKRQPKNSKYYRKRGLCHFEMKNWDMAASDLREELKLDPNNIDAVYYFIRTLFAAGKVDEALKITRTWDSGRLMDVGKKFDDAKEYQEAVKLYSEAAEMFQLPAAYKLRGECYLKLNDTDRAISDFKKGLDIEPENIKNRFNLSDLYYKLGKYNEAIDETIYIGGNSLESLGNKFFRENKFKEALRCYHEAIIHPRDKDDRSLCNTSLLHEERGRCYGALRKYEDAISDFEKSLNSCSDRDIILLSLVGLFEVQMESGRVTQADTTFEEIRRMAHSLPFELVYRIEKFRKW